MKILIATQNPGKIREYRRLFAGSPVSLVSPADIGLVDVEVDETGDTFEENAALKAGAYARLGGMAALADDSGLMVDALGGAPGIHSARFGGPELDDAGKRKRILDKLYNLPDSKRGAKFVCVIALVLAAEQHAILFRGECRGRITHAEYDAGHGFGYDPIFQPDGYDLTFGQMTAAQKNGISHRSIAAAKALVRLQDIVVGARHSENRTIGDGNL